MYIGLINNSTNLLLLLPPSSYYLSILARYVSLIQQPFW